MKTIFELSYKTHSALMNEIDQLDESFGKSRERLQADSICIVNEYIGRKSEIASITKRRLKEDEDDDIELELDDLKDQFDEITDGVWYTLNEMETLMHERIEEIRKIFSKNVREVIEGLLQSLRPIFEEIKIAGQEYYLVITKKYEQNQQQSTVIDEAIKTDRTAHWETSQRIQDDFFDCVSGWMVKMLDQYEM